MTRTRSFAPLLGLAALAALALLSPATRAQTSYTVVDLNNSFGSEDQYALAVSSTAQGGVSQSDSNPSHATLWHGTAASAVDLSPTQYGSQVAGMSDSAQVGYGIIPVGDHDGVYHAFLWHGTVASSVDLNPAGYEASAAFGVSGDTQAGSGYFGTILHALLWQGTAASFVDLNPAGYALSQAYGVSGDTQVGYGIVNRTADLYHAFLWHGTAASVVDLTPSGATRAQAFGVSGGTQVGYATVHSGYDHAVLWHGTAASVVDLNPAGFDSSKASGISGSTQVGSATKSNGAVHAIVWHGTAASAVDLNTFLPAAYNSGYTRVAANAVAPNGDIVGTGYNDDDGFSHALLWHLSTSPALTVTSLSPSVVDLGSAAFTLTVSGTGFAPSTVVRWNGQTLTTTYVSASKLTASVPASLVTNIGTADITVQTPHVATSGAATFHIRPVISSLSPSTKTAGAGAFTLTVNGMGFTTNSIVVFNTSSGTTTNLVTTFVSSTKLTATVPASILTAGRKSVKVTIPHVATSRGFAFTITP